MDLWRQRAWWFRAVSRLPRSRPLRAATRLVLDALDGENFADPGINGEARLVRERLPAAKVVFDVGASDGSWTALAVAANPAVAVHCFEPGPRFAELAARPFGSGVVRNHLGLAAEEAERVLYTDHGSVFERSPGPSVVAPFTTLDRYCARAGVAHIDVLKIDVEGLELDVLRGGRGLLQAGRIDLVQFEYSAFTSYARVLLRDFFELLEPLGYRLHQVFPHHLEPRRYDVALENYRYKNFVALR